MNVQKKIPIHSGYKLMITDEIREKLRPVLGETLTNNLDIRYASRPQRGIKNQ